ncbi:MAG: hypothetical protein ACTSVZ_11990 [Promethearchaeota archaeon]
MTVVISQSDSRKNLVVNGLEMLKNQSQVQFSAKPVLLIIDIPSPIGHPWSLDCGSLLCLVDYLKKNRADEIYLFPSLHYHFEMEKVLETLGLMPFLESKALCLWNPWLEPDSSQNGITDSDQPIIENPTLAPSSDFGTIIVYTQLRTMGSNSLWSSLSQLFSLHIHFSEFSKTQADFPVNHQINPSGEILWEWLGNMFEKEIFDLPPNFPPPIIINDGFNVVNSESQYFWDEAQLYEPHFSFIGTDLREVEQITFDYLTINQETAWFYKTHPNFRVTTTITPVITSNMDSLDPYVLKFSQNNDPYTKQHFQVLPGKLDDKEELQFYIITPLLRGILYDDFPNHEKIAVLMGNAPPDPPLQASIIIYGDNALEATEDARFQFLNTHELEKEPFILLGIKIGGSRILSDDALEREILSKQRKLRQKIDKAGQKFEEFKISLGEKEIHEERDYLILLKNKKFQMQVQIIRMKIETLRINMQAKNDLLKIKLLEPKLIENKNIIRIPTDRSFGLDFLVDLAYHWKKGKSPALHIFYRICENFYRFPLIPQGWHKDQRNIVKKFIQSIMQEWSTPLQPEIKNNAQKIREHQKEALARIKSETNVANSKIAAECDPTLAELSAKVRQLKKENQKLKKTIRKEKFQTYVQDVKNLGDKFSRSVPSDDNSSQNPTPIPSPSTTSSQDDTNPDDPLKEETQ